MQHHWTLITTTVLIDVADIKALWKVHIDLQRAALPVPTDRVTKNELKLGTVEGTLTWEKDVVQAHNVECITQRALELIPNLITTDAVLRSRRQLDNDIVKTEILVDIEHQFHDVDTLLLHLLLGTVDVRIVLREVTHTHQAM